MSTSLRNQFIDHMTLKGFSDCTKKSYVTGVMGLAKYYNQSPDLLTKEKIHLYIRHLIVEKKVNWYTCNSYLSGIVYFYKNICHWEDVGRFGTPRRERPSRFLPKRLSNSRPVAS